MSLKTIPTLSERLRYIRDIKNLSQAELAQYAGTTQQAIQQAEKGKARHPRYLHTLAKALDLPLEWVLYGQEGEAQNESMPSQLVVTGFAESHGSTSPEIKEEVLDNFFNMPKEDQDLMLQLMKSRRTNSEIK